jgi:hypothetical protein
MPGYLTQSVLMRSHPERLDRLLHSYVLDRLRLGHRPSKVYAELYSAYRIVLRAGGSDERKDVILSAMESLQEME